MLESQANATVILFKCTAGLALSGLLLAVPARAGLPAPPVEQWQYEGNLYASPLVVQLSDDDGDGVVGPLDDPDVLVIGLRSPLIALDGRTGLPTPGFASPLASGTGLAAADLDGDGEVEIVATDFFDDEITVVETHGSISYLIEPPMGGFFFGVLGIADLNGDGIPEVHAGGSVTSVDETWAWVGSSWSGAAGILRQSLAADLDPTSPGLELLAGPALYAADGALLRDDPGLSDGLVALGDFDGDDLPEIVMTYSTGMSGRVRVMNGDFTPIGPELEIETGTNVQVSAPVVADLDGDGRPDVVVPTTEFLTAYGVTPMGLSFLWQVDTMTLASATGATAFDFDGDGASEVVYRDEHHWYVIEGLDGTVLHEEEYTSGTAAEMPVVANIDDDPAAEILVPSLSEPGLIVYEVPGSCTPRPIWNQQGYQPSLVDDAGVVSAPEVLPWIEPGTWHAQVGGCCALPTFDDVSVVDPSDCNSGLSVSWTAADFGADGGVYNVYRSVGAGASCADALAAPPIATGLVDTVWWDGATTPGEPHVYVVEAEADRSSFGCMETGVELGGPVERACTDAVVDEGTAVFPDGVYAVLRMAYDEPVLTAYWPGTRALLPGEHFHLLHAVGSPLATWTMINPEGETGESFVEPNVDTRMQFFDLRVANACEDVSLDEYPPGR